MTESHTRREAWVAVPSRFNKLCGLSVAPASESTRAESMLWIYQLLWRPCLLEMNCDPLVKKSYIGKFELSFLLGLGNKNLCLPCKVFSWKEADTLENQRASHGFWVESSSSDCSPWLWHWWPWVVTRILDTVLNQLSLLPLPPRAISCEIVHWPLGLVSTRKDKTK